MQVTDQEETAAAVMLRVYNDGHKGATAFFRNRPFLQTLFSEPTLSGKTHITIFVHACSIGAEPYSLALWWLRHILPTRPGATLDIVATDIDPEFLEVARHACYPEQILDGMTEQERSWFKKEGDAVMVPDEARALVRFVEPANFVSATLAEEVDVVLIMNALTYVTAQDQATALVHAAGYARHLLCLTAFHPDSIAEDAARIGFVPSMRNHQEIHDAWLERISDETVPPGHPDYSWRLPPYDTSHPDYAARFGVIFRRDLGDANGMGL
jgi:chemotaxis methyl-accepting protein methylase